MRLVGAMMAAVIATLWTMAGCRDDVSAAPAPPVAYVYVPFPGRPISICFGEVIHVGTIDGRGAFNVRERLPSPKEQPSQLNDSPVGFIFSVERPIKCYEFRSRRLIWGR